MNRLGLFVALLMTGAGLLGCTGSKARWERMNTSTNESLRLVHTMSGDTAIAITFRSGRVLRTVDGGKNWVYSARFSSRRVETLHDGVNGEHLLAGYGQSVLISSDGGEIWHPRALKSSVMLLDMVTLPDSSYLAVGKAFGEGPPSAYAVIRRLGQTAWEEVELPTTEPALAADMSGDQAIVAFGDAIWSYDQKANSWAIRHTSHEESILHSINDIDFDGDYGLAIGDHGYILTTTNGGKSWRQSHNSSNEDLYCVLIDENDAWIGGDQHIWHRHGRHGSFRDVLAPNTGRTWDIAMLNGMPVAVGDGGAVLMPVR
jgi:photosystem II stability/assembly factor-like uncharacterized protein